MQPLGANGNLEADASCQEEEDEEEEAVWLREQAHCKMTSVQDHLLRGSAIVCSGNRREMLPGGCWGVGGGTGERAVCVGLWAGQRRGAGVGNPEGCFTITVRRHGARVCVCVGERYRTGCRGIGKY